MNGFHILESTYSLHSMSLKQHPLERETKLLQVLSNDDVTTLRPCTYIGANIVLPGKEKTSSTRAIQVRGKVRTRWVMSQVT